MPPPKFTQDTIGNDAAAALLRVPAPPRPRAAPSRVRAEPARGRHRCGRRCRAGGRAERGAGAVAVARAGAARTPGREALLGRMSNGTAAPAAHPLRHAGPVPLPLRIGTAADLLPVPAAVADRAGAPLPRDAALPRRSGSRAPFSSQAPRSGCTSSGTMFELRADR